MGQQLVVLPSPEYLCVKCGRASKRSELDALPAATCVNCGFRVFAKSRRQIATSYKAV